MNRKHAALALYAGAFLAGTAASYHLGVRDGREQYKTELRENFKKSFRDMVLEARKAIKERN